MNSLPPFIAHALTLPPVLKYSVIVVISMFEGPIIFTVSGFFLRLNTEHLLPLFIILGNFLGDTLWYCIGYFFAGKLVRMRGSFLGITKERLTTAEDIFEEYGGRMLVLSKATIGFGTSVGVPAMLMSAGMLKFSFWRYMKYNAVAELLLLIIFIAIGYIFGISYQSVSEDLRETTVAAFFILLVVAFIGFRIYKARTTI